MEKHSVENEKSIGAERKIVRLRTENHLAQKFLPLSAKKGG
jgi:hypothetical protein